MVTEGEAIGWVAGIFEGEGSAILLRVGSGWRRRLRIANTERDVVERALRILGAGRVRLADRSWRDQRWKPELWWEADRWLDIERVSGLLYAFLGQRRRSAIDAIYDHPAKRALVDGHYLTVDSVVDPRETLREPAPAEWWAWAAGLFEGEGSAICRPTSQRRGKQLQRRLQVALSDREVLERFVSVVGTGKVRALKDRGLTRKGNSYKAMFIWTCSRWLDIERICARFGPFMGARRTEQIAVLLAHPAGPIGGRPPTHCKRGHPLIGPNADVYVYGRERQCRKCKALAYASLKAGGPRASRPRQLHCIRGHPLSGDDADVYEWRGLRQCRPCASAARAARRRRGRVRPRQPRASS